MSLTVLIAPSGFKECLDPFDVAEAMAEGVARAWPDARLLKAPIADGGEGFTRALTIATHGTLHPVDVTGPLGSKISAHVGILGGADKITAVVEISAACGLSRVPRDRRNPALTTSFGVGELILKALDLGAEHILVGCGDSGVNDGGAGMIQALGGLLTNADHDSIGFGGAELNSLSAIDLSGLDQRLRNVTIDVTVNWHNDLLGPRGVTRVYGPQKGAMPDQIARLEAGLAKYASLIRATTGINVAVANGTGASGGLGAAFLGLLRAKLHPRYDIILQYLRFDELLAQADLVLTAEGALDEQTPYGKVPAEVGRRARERGIPVFALAGSIGPGAKANHEQGIAAYSSIITAPCSLEDAMSSAERLLADATEQVVRTVGAGISLSQNHHERFQSARLDRLKNRTHKDDNLKLEKKKKSIVDWERLRSASAIM